MEIDCDELIQKYNQLYEEYMSMDVSLFTPIENIPTECVKANNDSNLYSSPDYDNTLFINPSAFIWQNMYDIYNFIKDNRKDFLNRIKSLDDLDENKYSKTPKNYGNTWKNMYRIRINELLTFTKMLDYKPKVIVELGVWEGNSTEAWCQIAEKVYAIDIFENPKFTRLVKPKYDNVSFIKSDSCDAAKDFEDNSIDMVYIDGDHRYEKVCKDIISWFPKVKTNGYIAGHDFLVSTQHDTKSSERVNLWDKNCKNGTILERYGVKIVGRNDPGKAIIDTLGLPDWWDAQNPPHTSGANWFFKKTPELKINNREKKDISQTSNKCTFKIIQPK